MFTKQCEIRDMTIITSYVRFQLAIQRSVQYMDQCVGNRKSLATIPLVTIPCYCSSGYLFTSWDL